MKTEAALEKRAGAEGRAEEPTRQTPRYRPAVDILEDENELLLIADVPGADPTGIDVNYEDARLIIHARVDSRQPEGVTYLHREYGVGDFYRVFEVSEAIDAEKITAEYNQGVLTLHLPKTEQVKPRKIEVQTNGQN